MHSLFDNVYLGKPCAEQHMREIRQEIEAEQLAHQVQVSQSGLEIDTSQPSRSDAREAVGRFWSNLVMHYFHLTKLVKVLDTDGDHAIAQANTDQLNVSR